jgi:hypothetical protein
MEGGEMRRLVSLSSSFSPSTSQSRLTAFWFRFASEEGRRCWLSRWRRWRGSRGERWQESWSPSCGGGSLAVLTVAAATVFAG